MNPKTLVDFSSRLSQVKGVSKHRCISDGFDYSVFNAHLKEFYIPIVNKGFVFIDNIAIKSNCIHVSPLPEYSHRILEEYDGVVILPVRSENTHSSSFRYTTIQKNFNDSKCSSTLIDSIEPDHGEFTERALYIDTRHTNCVENTLKIYDFIDKYRRSRKVCISNKFSNDLALVQDKVVNMMREASYGKFVNKVRKFKPNHAKLVEDAGLECFLEAVKKSSYTTLKKGCSLHGGYGGYNGLISSILSLRVINIDSYNPDAEPIIDYMRSNPVKDPAS